MSPCVSAQCFYSRHGGQRQLQSKHTALAWGGSAVAKAKAGEPVAKPHPLLQRARLNAANPRGCPSSGSTGEARGVQAERTGIGTKRGSWSSTPVPSPSRSRGAPAQGGGAGGRSGGAVPLCWWSGERCRPERGARASCSALARLAHRDLPGTGEAEVVFFPRWQNRRAGRAGGTQSLLLSSLAPSWGRRWNRACCFLPSCASSSSGPAPLPHAQLARRRCLSPGSGAKAPG